MIGLERAPGERAEIGRQATGDLPGRAQRATKHDGRNLQGALYLQPGPASLHARTGLVLGGKIGGPFDFDSDGPRGWWIVDEPELHLGEELLVPDLAGWPRERLPQFSLMPFSTHSPYWVCEMLSQPILNRDCIDTIDIYRKRRLV